MWARSIFSGVLLAAASAGNALPEGRMACEREIIRASARYGVPLAVLYGVGLTETGRKQTLHAFALNVEGKARFSATREEAIASFKEARADGAKLIDVGCMQVNHFYHGARFSGVGEMLDPARNVDYAARFLAELKRREGNWTMAAARYHAGPENDAAQKAYVCRVIANMAASGFGAWTSEARKFCQE